jgi:hypothetical protein
MALDPEQQELLSEVRHEELIEALLGLTQAIKAKDDSFLTQAGLQVNSLLSTLKTLRIPDVVVNNTTDYEKLSKVQAESLMKVEKELKNITALLLKESIKAKDYQVDIVKRGEDGIKTVIIKQIK